jgi:hypothetical protein
MMGRRCAMAVALLPALAGCAQPPPSEPTRLGGSASELAYAKLVIVRIAEKVAVPVPAGSTGGAAHLRMVVGRNG